MDNHTAAVLGDILAVLVAAVVVVSLLRRLRLPPILGYLFVGVVLGPHALGWFNDDEAVHLLGEIGVAFLLFTIGLEFSIAQFMAMRRTLLGLGGAQVILGTFFGGLIAWIYGVPWQGALILGAALSMSSTAIVIKQLTDQAELQAHHGRMSLGILLFQDLAAVPFLVVIPILAAGAEGSLVWPLGFALVKGVLAVAIMLGLGYFALRPLFHEIASSHSAELFTLTVLLVSLFAAWITALLGLSLALGTFLGGMMLAETEYRHQIEIAIRPFRDVLLGLFFIVVGTELNLVVLPESWPWVLLLTAGLVFGKGPLIMLLTRVATGSWAVAVRTGIVLGHAGEFGFALLALALAQGLVVNDQLQPTLTAAVISMVLAPIFIRHNESLGKYLLGSTSTESPPRADEVAEAVGTVANHVVICGFGRVGQTLARFLREVGIDYVALDLDPQRVTWAWENGDRVFYGDSANREILMAAGLEEARVVVVSFDDFASSLAILQAVQRLRPGLPTLVRTRDDSQLTSLQQAGATEVVPETLEASLMLVTQLLLLLELPPQQVHRRIQSERDNRYRLLQNVAESSSKEDVFSQTSSPEN